MSKRPSPTESAASLDELTIKQGNDGDMWITIGDKNKIQRWQKICTLKKNKIDDVNLRIFDTVYNKLAKPQFVYLGTIKINGNLSIGDSIAYSVDNFGSGIYHIYRYNQNLVAAKQKITLNRLISTHFRDNGNVTVDYGIFVYRDVSPLLKYNDFMLDMLNILDIPKREKDIINKSRIVLKKKLKGKNILINIPDHLLPLEKKDHMKATDSYVIKCSAMDFISPLIKDIYDNKRKLLEEYRKTVFSCKNSDTIIIASGNGAGDGTFPVIIDKANKIVIQCGRYYSDIFYRIERAIDVIK